ncbi:MAG: hypothetical protein IKP72_14920 [Clostridia bacterium]|nr:hypothetical protein [Clostridia bacterium]
MATYMVEVNAKFMVRLEIEGSALAAEHYFLDSFKGVWGAMAYDQKAMKTDCFIGAMMHDDLTTVEALTSKLDEYNVMYEQLEMTAKRIKTYEEEIEKLTREKEEIEEAYKAKLIEWGEAQKALNAKRPQ